MDFLGSVTAARGTAVSFVGVAVSDTAPGVVDVVIIGVLNAGEGVARVKLEAD